MPSQFKAVCGKPAAVTCEIEGPAQNGFYVRTNPGSYRFIVQLAPQVQMPPAATKGALVTFFGEYQQMTPKYEIIFVAKQVTHHTQPGASLAKIPTKGG